MSDQNKVEELLSELAGMVEEATDLLRYRKTLQGALGSLDPNDGISRRAVASIKGHLDLIENRLPFLEARHSEIRAEISYCLFGAPASLENAAVMARRGRVKRCVNEIRRPSCSLPW